MSAGPAGIRAGEGDAFAIKAVDVRRNGDVPIGTGVAGDGSLIIAIESVCEIAREVRSHGQAIETYSRGRETSTGKCMAPQGP